MADELRQLLDRTNIIETINRVFIATDNRDWEAAKTLFAPRVRLDMSSMGAGDPVDMTPQQIVDGWDEGLKKLEAIHHQSGNFLVDVDGDTARATCYGIASHYLSNPTGRNTRTFVGSYEFSLARAGEGWVITALTFLLKYIDGNPDLESS